MLTEGGLSPPSTLLTQRPLVPPAWGWSAQLPRSKPYLPLRSFQKQFFLRTWRCVISWPLRGAFPGTGHAPLSQTLLQNPPRSAGTGSLLCPEARGVWVPAAKSNLTGPEGDRHVGNKRAVIRACSGSKAQWSQGDPTWVADTEIISVVIISMSLSVPVSFPTQSIRKPGLTEKFRM